MKNCWFCISRSSV